VSATLSRNRSGTRDEAEEEKILVETGAYIIWDFINQAYCWVFIVYLCIIFSFINIRCLKNK
jgi:hypothetical protein